MIVRAAGRRASRGVAARGRGARRRRLGRRAVDASRCRARGRSAGARASTPCCCGCSPRRRIRMRRATPAPARRDRCSRSRTRAPARDGDHTVHLSFRDPREHSMNIFDLPVLSALLAAATAGLAALGAVVTPAGAVVLVTLAVRALLIPVGVSLARADRARRRLAPRARRAAEALGEEPRAPAARDARALRDARRCRRSPGILPVLAQAPVLTLVYATVHVAEIAGSPVRRRRSARTSRRRDLAPVDRRCSRGCSSRSPVIASPRRRSRLRSRHGADAADAVSGRRVRGACSWLRRYLDGDRGAAFLPLRRPTLYLAISSAWSLAEREPCCASVVAS